MIKRDGITIGDTVSELFMSNGTIDSEAIGKEYDLKLLNGVVGHLAKYNVGEDDNSIVFEVVETFNQQIDSNTDELEANQTNKKQYSRLIDARGDDIFCTEANQLMVAESERLIGGVFNGTTPDANFYTTVLVANGTANIVNAELNLATTTDINSSAIINTLSKARCIGGNMNQYRERIRLSDTGKTNNVRRWGMCETTALLNGVYFQLSGTTFSVVAKTNGLADIVVNSGSFNGTIASYALDTNYHLYTINYVNGLFKMYIDDVLIHEFKETTSIICGTRHLRVFSQNTNTGVGSVCNIYCRFMTIVQFGSRKTQPRFYNQIGTTTGVLLKVGVGSLHQMNVSAIINNSVVTLRDGINATGPIIYTTGAMTAQTIPLVISFNDGINFETGLFLVISGANSNAQVIYE